MADATKLESPVVGSHPLMRFRLRLYAFAVLNDFVPLVPVVALLFADAGLGTGVVSLLFLLLTAAALVLEVPAGTWADITSRRRLLALGALLRSGTFVLWLVAPSYPSFVAGVLLWGACHALTSGTLEALVYEELLARQSAHRYPGLIGRVRTAALGANLLATATAAPLFALRGYPLVIAVCALVCLATAVVAFQLPESTLRSDERISSYRSYLVMLQTGFAEIRQDRRVRRAALLAGALPAILVLDEYLPLLARSMGAATATIPLLIMFAVLAKAVGGYLAGPLRLTRPASLALLLAIGVVLLVVGSLSRHLAGFVAVALSLGIIQLSIVLAQVRLQEVIKCGARATVTSAAGLVTHITALFFYAAYGLGSIWWELAALVAGFATVPALVAAVMPHWLPTSSQQSSTTPVSEG